MIDPNKLKCGQIKIKTIIFNKKIAKNGQMIFLINCAFQTTFILFWARQTA